MKIKVYDRLPDYARRIREKVFGEEQGFQNEFDEIDDKAAHVVAFCEDGLPMATCRVFWDEKKNTYIIGRLAVLKEYRGQSVGSELLKETEKYIVEQGGREAALHAQCRASKFYQKLGFCKYGNVEDDEGCTHIWMSKQL